MAIHVTCDLCGKEPALNLSRRMAIGTREGRRLLVSVRVEVDEGDKEPRAVDIGLVCLKKAIVGLE